MTRSVMKGPYNLEFPSSSSSLWIPYCPDSRDESQVIIRRMQTSADRNRNWLSKIEAFSRCREQQQGHSDLSPRRLSRLSETELHDATGMHPTHGHLSGTLAVCRAPGLHHDIMTMQYPRPTDSSAVWPRRRGHRPLRICSGYG